MPRYNPATIEPQWQQYWQQNRTFVAPRLPRGPKLYVLDMFPYPSGDGLHVGHPEGYTATDIVARYARMRGKSVLHPMGWDAFGLPAEEHAIKTNTPPRVQTEKNIDTFRRQLQMIGFSYDWQREVATTDVEYFRWTQWIFLQLYDTWFDEQQQRGRPIDELPIPAEVQAEGLAAVAQYQDSHRLAYQTEAPVNWCPKLGTVLANEEVQDGKSEVGGHPVVRMPLRQWMLRITAYAERLQNDLDGLDWSTGIKHLQRNWIGRSEGAEIDFFIGTAEQRAGGVPTDDAYEEFTERRREAFRLDETTGKRMPAGFPKQPGGDVLRVYTTRPDTLFGATYMVIAPEHPAVATLTTDAYRDAVASYCERAARKSDMDRTELAKDKTGVFTGSYARNPVNGESIPIWIADYVLISYGTGAIMAVPAHDTRDFEFAQQYDIPIVAVVDPGEQADEAARADVLAGRAALTVDGTAINSGRYNGMLTAEFKRQIAEGLWDAGVGRQAVNYKLRDWLFSRQRFWGEPFPILHELDGDGQPTGVVRSVPEADLPVDLPHLDDFKPHGRPEPPLDKAPDDWLYPVIDGVRYKRETNTMPQWAGSCWYYLRFLDPKNDQRFVDPEIEKAWMPVDLYVGGAEHAVLHLLYARFWHKVLYDRGHVSTKEPFQKLVNQGMILGEIEYDVHVRVNESEQVINPKIYVSAEDAWKEIDEKPSDVDYFFGEDGKTLIGNFVLETVPSSEVVVRGKKTYWTHEGEEYEVEGHAQKMSKSRGNVVNPDKVVKEYGADSLRLYEMFMGPLEAVKPWSMDGVSGVRNFLDRAWRMIVDERAETLALNPAVQDIKPSEEQDRELHKTIQKVTHDCETLSFNTAIAKMMECTNFFLKQDPRPKSAMEQFVLLLSPFAPHIAEELWKLLGHDDTLAYEEWPIFDEAKIKEDAVDIPVQIKGKLRARVRMPADADNAQIEQLARSDERIAALLADATVVKVVIVPGRLVNFVTR